MSECKIFIYKYKKEILTNKLKQSIKDLEISKEKINAKFTELANLESEIASVMAKLEINKLPEVDYNKFIKGSA